MMKKMILIVIKKVVIIMKIVILLRPTLDAQRHCNAQRRRPV